MTSIGLAQSRRAVEEARRLYRRTLAGWAMDNLMLRQAGLNRPSVRGTQEPCFRAPMRKAA